MHPFRATLTLATARKATLTATSSVSRSPAPPKNPATASAAQKKTPPLHRPCSGAVRWTSAQLHQHNWYSATECPHRTKAHWSDFLAKVDENIAAIKAASEDHPAPSVPQVTLIALGKALDIPAENRNGTVYAPVRALCEALGFDVEWKDGEVKIA